MPAGARARRRAPADSFVSRRSNEFGRGISFLDAIYGFAATLLIANVDAPPAEAWTSLKALGESSVPAQALGFALSFTVIAVFWRVNVRLVRRLRGLDGVTIAINLLASGLVILIAYTTQGISDPSTADLPLPTAFYAANIALVALCQTAMFQVARARGLERVPTSRRHNLLDTPVRWSTPLVFLVSIPIAMTWGATAGKLTWASPARARAAGGHPDRASEPRTATDMPLAGPFGSRPGVEMASALRVGPLQDTGCDDERRGDQHGVLEDVLTGERRAGGAEDLVRQQHDRREDADEREREDDESDTGEHAACDEQSTGAHLHDRGEHHRGLPGDHAERQALPRGLDEQLERAHARNELERAEDDEDSAECDAERRDAPALQEDLQRRLGARLHSRRRGGSARCAAKTGTTPTAP